jgi:acyl-CoA thioester hydrolase
MSSRIPAARMLLANYPFHCELRVRLSDIDSGRHVNNAVVAEFHEETRAQMHIGVNGFEGVMGDRAGTGVIAHVSMDFLQEILWGFPVIGACGVVKFGRTSYGLAQALFQQDRCVGVCDTTIVWREDGRAAPLRPQSKQRLQQLMIRNY